MNVLYSIPPPHAVTVTHPGLLYAPVTDLANWLMYALMVVAALAFMPGELRRALGELWRPVAAWLAGLRAPGAWRVLWIPLFVLRATWRVLWFIVDSAEQVSVRWARRLAYPGFDVPETT